MTLPAVKAKPHSNSLWGLVEEISRKKGITEIIINRPDKVFIEKEGKLIHLEFKTSPEEILKFIEEIAAFNDTVCNRESPILDGLLPDGSRVNVIMNPFSRKSPSITIRRYLPHIKRFDSVPGIFGLNESWIRLLKVMVAARLNIIVSGGTGVGKTTFLNLMLQELSQDERIITIEDTCELHFAQNNWVQLETGGSVPGGKNKLTIRDLVKNTLRMRPDRIIIGEVRGGEIFDLLQAMNTGHDGSMTSIHSNSPAECLKRICTLYMVAGYEVPIVAIREQVSTAVDFIIQLGRTSQGQRVVSKIVEVTGLEGGNFLLQDVGDLRQGKLASTGIVPVSIDRLVKAGLERDYFNSDF